MVENSSSSSTGGDSSGGNNSGGGGGGGAVTSLRDACTVFGIPPPSARHPLPTRDALRRQFRALALRHHPDKRAQGDAAAAAETFCRVTSAYELLLRCAARRETHDSCLRKSDGDGEAARGGSSDSGKGEGGSGDSDDSDSGTPGNGGSTRRASPSAADVGLLLRALRGLEVEDELQRRGAYRPPASFGVGPPFVPFNAGAMGAAEPPSTAAGLASASPWASALGRSWCQRRPCGSSSVDSYSDDSSSSSGADSD